MKKLFGAHWVMDTLFEIAGSILIAAAIYNFAVPAKFPMTGFSGIALIIYRLTSLPIGTTTIILNVPVALLCYKLIGRNFFFKSLRCMVISSLFIDYLAPLFPLYTGNRILAAICTGVLGGIGYGIIYLRNSSTGGSDFIVMAIKSKFQHIKLGSIIFLLDMLVILAGGVIFGDFDGVILGLIVDYLFAIIADKLMYGINAGKFTMIITKDGDAVSKMIDSACDRGSTIVPAIGSYTKEKRDVVLCACSTKDMILVEQAVREADPAAFTIILESNEVLGEGFRSIRIAEPEQKVSSRRHWRKNRQANG